MPSLNTRDLESIAGAMYFIVGRGTEGGTFSYRLAIAGITFQGPKANWGKSEEVLDNSGYSLGTLQIDLGQRGTWPLGATENVPLQPGQATYVDALIVEVATYAQEHHLRFTSDRHQLRADLLSHGNGKRHRGTLAFIEADTRDTFNAWASSKDGKKWIHGNIDYPQVRNASKAALDMLQADGKNIPENHRLETLAILAKTANQMPAQLPELKRVLRNGGDYEEVLAKANDIMRHHRHYAGPKAASLAGRYLSAHEDKEVAAALDRAQTKVVDADFDPSTAAADPDFQEALRAIGQIQRVRVLRQGSQGDRVIALQADLAKLHVTDAHGRALHVDGDFGPGTHAAVVKFQHAHGLEADGLAGRKTLQTLHEATRLQSAALAYYDHPGHPLFCQALRGVQLLDAKCGRTPDYLSENLAGSLATAARAQGLGRIDYVVLGENAARVLAVQGELESPLRQVAGVDVLPAIATPLLRSSAEFQALPPPAISQRPGEAPMYQALAGPSPSAGQR